MHYQTKALWINTGLKWKLFNCIFRIGFKCA